MTMQQIILMYPIFDQFISFRFSFEQSWRENRLKALQLQEQVFLNKGNFMGTQRLFSVKYLFGELHILLSIFFYFRAANNF